MGLVAVVGTGLRLLVILLLLIALVVPLVLGIAYGVAADRSEGTADGGTFKAAAALVADNASEGRPTEATDHGTGLSIGTRGTGDAGKSHSENSKFSEFGFHWFDYWDRRGTSRGWTGPGPAVFRTKS